MSFETVKFEKQGSLAHIVLNRPRVLNAYNVQMRDDLYEALLAVRDDPDVRVMLLRGEGDRAFCAGADLTQFGTAPSQAIARQVRWERDVWGLFLELNKPCIALLHGYVVGSGLEMALLCDIRIASDDAQFILPEVALGMIPAAGGTQTLSRVIGASRAVDMLLTGRSVGAVEAQSLGLVHRVVSKQSLEEYGVTLGGTLAQTDVRIHKYIKESIRLGCDLSMEAALSLEDRLATVVLSSDIVK